MADLSPLLPAADQLKEILVATDFTPAATAGLRFAAALARKYGARIHLAHAVGKRPSEALPGTAASTWQWARRVGRQQLDAVGHSAMLAGVAHRTYVLEGLPERTLRDLVGDEHIDLAVIGASGRSAGVHRCLGSTSEKIVHALPCPVLIVGPSAWYALHDGELHSILAACGQRASSARRVVEYASRFARDCPARLTLMHASPLRNSRTVVLFQAAETRLEALKPGGVFFGTAPETRVDVGAPVDCILNAAAEVNADLIVMGSGAAGLSTVTHAVVGDAPCPVLTLPG